MITFDELTRQLAVDLAYLREEDWINFRTDRGYVQIIQYTDHLFADIVSHHPLTDTQRQRLVDAGWQPPTGQYVKGWEYRVPWPLSGETAVRTARLLTDAIHEILDPDLHNISYDTRNYTTGAPYDLRSLRTLRQAAVTLNAQPVETIQHRGPR